MVHAKEDVDEGGNEEEVEDEAERGARARRGLDDVANHGGDEHHVEQSEGEKLQLNEKALEWKTNRFFRINEGGKFAKANRLLKCIHLMKYLSAS